MVTWLEVAPQGAAPVIVHWNTLFPDPKPVTVEVGDEGVVIVPDPLTNVHTPDPMAAVFPASVATVPQIAWLEPALATVGEAIIVRLPVALAAAHPPPAAMELVSVYAPGRLLDRSTSPVEVLTNTSPAGVALNIPALAPAAKDGNGLVPDWQ